MPPKAISESNLSVRACFKNFNKCVWLFINRQVESWEIGIFMRLWVKGLATGAEFGTRDYNVQESEPVWNLITTLATELGVHPTQIRLIFGGNKLDAHRTFGELNIFTESTLHMIVSPNVEPPPAPLLQPIPEPIPPTDAPMSCSKWGQTVGFISEEGNVWILHSLICVQLEGVTSIVQINISDHLKCLVNEQGEIFACGWNQKGQLGLGTYVAREKPTKIGSIPPVSFVACGTNHCAAIDYQSSLWVWGDNTSGQCGIPDESCYALPQQLKFTAGVRAVACGLEFTALLDMNYRVHTFGCNSQGQLGLG